MPLHKRRLAPAPAQKKKNTFAAPYIKDEKGKVESNLPELNYKKKQSGVYLIRKVGTKEILYVGFSNERLYRTLYRHFSQWIDISKTIKTRYTYPKFGYEVRIIFTTKQRAELLEKLLIIKIQPEDNPNKYKDYLDKKMTSKAEDIYRADVTDKQDFPF